MANKLYYGDNLQVLRDSIKDESVDLIYLDPPFNSNATYNVLFRAPSGESSQAQIEAFEDTWHWNPAAEQAYDEVLHGSNTQAAAMLSAMLSFLGRNDMMAYLAMMAVRLIELHRVLKPTGSLYLHCDPTASHYLKILLDAVFGKLCFQNEINWKRTFTHGDSRTWSRAADKIFFYTKGEEFTWNIPYEPLSESYIESHYSQQDEQGRSFQLTSILSPSPRPNMTYEWKGFPPPPMGWRFSRERMAELDAEGKIWYPTNSDGSYDLGKRPRFKRLLDEQKGTVITTVWTDISPLNSQSKERLGYPTQKPVALLERIVAASSNEGDVVFDPFCGCGTTVHAAEKLKRKWIGIDITHLAVSLIERRLREAFPKIKFETYGVPKDFAGAQALAEKNKFEFERWAVTLIPDAQPYKSKGGGDAGIDGVLYLRLGKKESAKAILSVKGGKNVGPAMVRDLKGTLEREKAAIGLFLTLTEPTREMTKEAVSAGYFEHEGKNYPKLQILTIESLLEGTKPDVPLIDSTVFKKATREDDSEDRQGGLDL